VLAQIGPVAERIARGKQAERILGATDMPPYFRVPSVTMGVGGDAAAAESDHRSGIAAPFAMRNVWQTRSTADCPAGNP